MAVHHVLLIFVRTFCRRVPQCRLRIAGKSIPIEKFCERKARRYLARDRLFFAHYVNCVC